jgi:hypothetical protein
MGLPAGLIIIAPAGRKPPSFAEKNALAKTNTSHAKAFFG